MFDPTSYGPTIAAILPPRLAPLGPGTPDPALRPRLAALDPTRDFGPIRNLHAARAALSGLWIYHDFLDESHTISQELDTPEGSCWHAIMHRREPDAGNSKYWWRRVGPHPVVKRLVELAPSLGYAFTTAQAFVDACERTRDSGTVDEELAMRVQFLEWQLLFDHCYQLACGRA